MKTFGVVALRYLLAAAVMLGLAFGSTLVVGEPPFGVRFSDVLKYASIALALILVGEVIRQVFYRMGWAPSVDAPSRGVGVDFGLALLVLSFLTLLLLVASR